MDKDVNVKTVYSIHSSLKILFNCFSGGVNISYLFKLKTIPMGQRVLVVHLSSGNNLNNPDTYVS
jgi:hypothetical protein